MKYNFSHISLKSVACICFFIMFSFFTTQHFYAQYSPKSILLKEDTNIKKNCLKPAIGFTVNNLAMWTICRYPLKKEWAYISLKTMKYNLNRGFVYDNDGFQTNNFDHPIGGSWSFTNARTSGLNYWQSIPYAFAGSMMWEYFLEKEPPSLPDLISTTIGGAALGELSSKIYFGVMDRTKKGFKRIATEAGCFLINPNEFFSDVLNGDLFKVYKEKSKKNVLPLYLNVGTGVAFFIDRKLPVSGNMSLTLNADFQYIEHDSIYKIKPFDYLDSDVCLKVFGNQPFLNKLNLEGIIWGKKIRSGMNGLLTAGIFQHFNYYDSDTVFSDSPYIPYLVTSTSSFGPGIIYSIENKELKRKHTFKAHFFGILMGAGVTDYYNVKKRNYNFGNGFGSKFVYKLKIKDFINIKAGIEHFHIITDEGMPAGTVIDSENFFDFKGDNGKVDYFIFTSNVSFKIFRNFSAYINYLAEYRNIKSDIYKHVKAKSHEINSGVLYNF